MNKNLQLKASIFAVLFCFVASARADWTPSARIQTLNPGGNGLHGTFVSLVDVSLAGCGSTTAAFLEGTNPNYKEFFASLLAAKMAEKEVRLLYSVCSSGYWVIQEVAIP